MKILSLLTHPVNCLIIAAFIACGSGNSASDSPPSLESTGSKTTAQEVAQASAVAVEGKLAPDFTLSRIDGGEVTLSELRGKVVILDFWATWCPPCVKGIPEFVELYNKYNSKGVDIVGISLDRGTSVVKRFLAKHKVPYPVVMAERQVVDFYQPAYIPTTYIIDPQGLVVTKVVGYHPKSFFETEIENLL